MKNELSELPNVTNVAKKIALISKTLVQHIKQKNRIYKNPGRGMIKRNQPRWCEKSHATTRELITTSANEKPVCWRTDTKIFKVS